MTTAQDEFRHAPPPEQAHLLFGDTLWVSVVDREANIFGINHFHLTNKGYARFEALYVIDGGPEGSIGDTSWIVEARRSGKIQALIVQGILATDLSRAADIVLPGASFAEKDASYTNDKGVLQGASRALNAPGDAQEDWQILVKLAAGLGVTLAYGSSVDIRQDISARLAAAAAEGMSTLSFSRPMSASTWLDASNPSERWKWEFLYQDLPPVKGSVEPSSLPPAPGVIRLSEVK